MREKNYILHYIIIILFIGSIPQLSHAQVNSVQFGKNVVQYNRLKWKFLQGLNFNVYFYQNGLDIAKYTLQVAEEEYRSIEKQMENQINGKPNILVYDNYDQYRQSNVGLSSNYQYNGGLTRFANDKIIVYFDGNHNHLRTQIREGIAEVILNSVVFGSNVGQFAINQVLLNLPSWLTEGYVRYVANAWDVNLDNQLRNLLLNVQFKNFYRLVYYYPELAGHAFWYYIALKYGNSKVTYFLNLATQTRSLNKASQIVTKSRFNKLLDSFMVNMTDIYENEIKGRRDMPKGRIIMSEDITPHKDLYRFAANPNLNALSYAVEQYKNGIYRLNFIDDDGDTHVLLKQGVRLLSAVERNPNYPVLAWDPTGTKIMVIYWHKGKIKMFIYDATTNSKRYEQTITQFDQIISATFMRNDHTVLLSAVKNGHTDIYTYDFTNNQITQYTDDIYDDVDPSFVAFPNRSGIIWSSNRPSGDAPEGDTILPSHYGFNIFLSDITNTNKIKQYSQLTHVSKGDARFPAQYGQSYFTYANSTNGINNRWAGFLTSKREGLDTIYFVGDQVLSNPLPEELDSVLAVWQKPEPDSIHYFQVYKDSTYTFPITNYQTSLLESNIAGVKSPVVSEVRQDGQTKYLYKLQVDQRVLQRRNITLTPTYFIKNESKLYYAPFASIVAAFNQPLNAESNPPSPPPTQAYADFQGGFENEILDSIYNRTPIPNQNPAINQNSNQFNSYIFPAIKSNPLRQTKLFNYKWKFNVDYTVTGLSNIILGSRFQPYQGGAGPIILNDGSAFSLALGGGVSDLLEDIKLSGSIRFSPDFANKDAFLSIQYLKNKLDWGISYYRSSVRNYQGFLQGNAANYANVVTTNIIQANATYPFDPIHSLRFSAGVRFDRGITRPFNIISGIPDPTGLSTPDTTAQTFIGHVEYVYDNTVNPTLNIWKGLKWKVYGDVYSNINKSTPNAKRLTYNIGFDARYYQPIFRNLIWAVRMAGDASFGPTKFIYYLGGADGWLNPQFNNANLPNPNITYTYQTLALNLRGFNQNVANGNNNLVINSEIRLPVITTFSRRPINNNFLRNLQLLQFIDLGSAWNGSVLNIARPQLNYNNGTPVFIRIPAGGVGPFAGGYGFGIRSTVLGYFLKLDVGWPMDGFFVGAPILYFSLGVDF